MPIAQTVTINEYCNKKKAHQLLMNLDYIFDSKKIAKEVKPIISNYCKEVLNTESGLMKKIYSKADYGRHFLKKNINGFQNIKRCFRSFLARDFYYDLDIKNCQPTLLLQYCKKNDIRCKALKYYVNNRDDIIEDSGLTKDVVKTEFIKVMYGGKFNYENFKNSSDDFKDFTKKFYKEMNYILEQVSELNPDVLKFVKSEPSKNNFYNNELGSTTALKMQDKESEIINFACKFLKIKNYDVGALCFDGVMVRNTIPLTENIIKELNKYILKKTDFEVEFLIKEFDKDIVIEDDNDFDENIYFIDHDKEGCDILLKKLQDQIIKCGNRYFEKYQGNIYIEDTSNKCQKIKDSLFKFINSFEIKMNTTVGPKPYSKTTNGAEKLLKMLWCNLPNDENFISKLWDSNIYKLCFLDGYYDYKTKSFKKYDNETYTTVYINYNYSDLERVSDCDMNYLKTKILDPILFNQEQQKYMLNYLARGLSGHYEEKTWGVALGNRNSGKSVLTDLCLNALNTYANDFTAEQLICQKSGSGDISKKMGWSIPFEFTRLSFSNELKTTDNDGKTLKLDGDCIKKVSSGGDKMKARLNYKDDITFKIQGRMILFMNDLIPITVQDAYETSSLFNFQSIFVDEITDDMKKINNIKEGQCKYFLKDNNIKSLIKNNYNNIHLSFIKLLIESYTVQPIPKPDIMKNNDDFKENDNNEIEQIKDLFEITLNHENKIPLKEVNESIKDNTTITKAKAKLILQKFGVVEDRNKNGRFYKGLKFK
jgi:hypothetical protein